jgi:hypothetical protein
MNKKETIQNLIKEMGGGLPTIQLTELEALTIINWIEQINPKSILELGTAFGGSGKIITHFFPDIKFITLDLPPEEVVAGKFGQYNKNGKYIWCRSKAEVGKYLPKTAIQLYGDGCKILPDLLKEYNPDLVFHDSSHIFEDVKINIEQCYEHRVKWIIVHDSHKQYLRAFFNDNPMYSEEYYIRDSRGVSVLKLKE